MSVLRLPDGRRLGWEESGDPAGTPFLFLHGTPQTRRARPADEELAGVRLIAFDRPGYGESDPDPRQRLTSVARDAGNLAKACGLDRFGVAGFSGGAAYALACGAVLGDRVTRVVAAALTGPGDELGTLSTQERHDLRRMRLIPGRGRKIVTAAASAYCREKDGEQFPAGLAGDWLATDVRRWRFRLADVRPPVLIWAGGQDPGRAVADAPLVAARIPHARVRVDVTASHEPPAGVWRELFQAAEQ
ncbi:alpha/beta fold hydrolase [Hamadaea tsunoensis]|uniref:alpha/beta fold hydrolase n=1 Tax=Hamadaea tsunoensis TaxID=53368 RepID=UPI0003FCC4AB|nr:alpha/beta hydrolase [Hamadaea tsunoensis]